jgi:basic membrane protein A
MNKKLLFNLMALLVVASMLLTACQPAATPTQPPAPAATEPPAAATQPPAAAFKACQVTDTGGIDDKSFNATAWKGV